MVAVTMHIFNDTLVLDPDPDPTEAPKAHVHGNLLPFQDLKSESEGSEDIHKSR